MRYSTYHFSRSEHGLMEYTAAPHADVAVVGTEAILPRSYRRQCSRRREDLAREGLRDCERRQLAQQIHDDLGAVLTAIKACICVATLHEGNVDGAKKNVLDDAVLLLDSAFATVRKIGADLRPMLLEEMGLWDAIEWQAKSLARRSTISVSFYTDAALESSSLSEDHELVIYRILTEAVINVQKHAQATQLHLRIYSRDGLLIAQAEDDGKGFDTDAAAKRGTLGMTGMREQAAEVGGCLALENRRGGGLGVYFAIPLELRHAD